MSIKNMVKSRFGRLFIIVTLCCFAAGAAGTAGIIIMARVMDKDLPSLEVLETYRTSLITKVYSADGKLLKEFFMERRELVPLEQIPQHLIDALTSTEDRKFYRHWGVDMTRTIQAVYINVLRGRKSQGASTITQQLARMLHLHRKKTWTRKIKEALTALKIERTYSKSEILQMYLNEYYFGHGRYGVQAAARYFFNKNVEDLNIPESAGLVGLLQRPAPYSPINHPERFIRRRNIILHLMARNKHITKAQADSLKQCPLELNLSTGAVGQAPYFVEHVRRILEKEHGIDILYKKGVSVYTTLDTRLQAFADTAIQKQLIKVQNIVDDKKPGTYKTFADIDSLDTKPVQVSFIAIDPKTGHIKAMTGGRNFEKSKFNRAVQAQRQPGSSFKPFVYTAAIDNGYSPAYTVIDNPIVIPMPDGSEYRPKNYGRKFSGPMMIRDGLRRSVNLIAIKLLQQVGPKQVIKYARKMGVESPVLPVLSMAVGSAGEVNLLEMVSAYCVYANKGLRARPIAITEIRDHDGNIIKKYTPYSEEALSEKTAYIMARMLEGVMNGGTGYGARAAGFKRPAGGKTGTTDECTDAWFIGFTPQLAAGAWVGYDDNTPMKHRMTGSSAALPIWTEFMIGAHDSLGWPEADFKEPPGIEKFRICKDSHQLANEYCPQTIELEFIKGTEPKKTCPDHSASDRGRTPGEREFSSQTDSLKQRKIKRRGLQF